MGGAFIELNFELIPGRFLKRLNRFMVLAEVNGREVYAHLPNSGRLTTAISPGDAAYFRRRTRDRGKSIYSIFAVQRGSVPVIVDSQFSNLLVRRVIESGLLQDLSGYRVIRENFKPYPGSRVRLDFLLEKDLEVFHIEVKCVTHVVDSIALFPDAPTPRGRQHIMEMITLMRNGFKAGLIFSVQRPDATMIRPNSKLDSKFTDLLARAIREGLKIFTVKSTFSHQGVIMLEAGKPRFQL